MKTILKTSLLTFVAVAFSAILFSFSNIEKNADKKYGGTANAIVEVDFTLVDSATKFVLQSKGIKEGNRRVVEVAINCNEDSYANAQVSLKKEVAYATKNYEKLVTPVGFDIHSCD